MDIPVCPTNPIKKFTNAYLQSKRIFTIKIMTVKQTKEAW